MLQSCQGRRNGRRNSAGYPQRTSTYLAVPRTVVGLVWFGSSLESLRSRFLLAPQDFRPFDFYEKSTKLTGLGAPCSTPATRCEAWQIPMLLLLMLSTPAPRSLFRTPCMEFNEQLGGQDGSSNNCNADVAFVAQALDEHDVQSTISHGDEDVQRATCGVHSSSA